MKEQNEKSKSKKENIVTFSERTKLTEKDFYPPYDDRLYCSGIGDIEGGDCYSEYVEYFWENYENDIYD